MKGSNDPKKLPRSLLIMHLKLLIIFKGNKPIDSKIMIKVLLTTRYNLCISSKIGNVSKKSERMILSKEVQRGEIQSPNKTKLYKTHETHFIIS